MMRKTRYHIKNKKPIFKKPIFWFFIFFVMIVLLCLYFFLFSSKIQIDYIVIQGSSNVQGKDIENAVWSNINKNISKSIFLTRPKIIRKNILNTFPAIESVQVSIQLPQTVNITIKERTSFAVFCQGEDESCFYIDEQGILFKPVEQIPQNIFIIRKSPEDREVFAGKKVVEKNIIDIISTIERDLKDNFQIYVKTFVISDMSRLNVETTENWQIYFNLDSEPSLQIVKMNLLLKNEISPSARKNLQYIDLRFKDRAYYK